MNIIQVSEYEVKVYNSYTGKHLTQMKSQMWQLDIFFLFKNCSLLEFPIIKVTKTSCYKSSNSNPPIIPVFPQFKQQEHSSKYPFTVSFVYKHTCLSNPSFEDFGDNNKQALKSIFTWVLGDNYMPITSEMLQIVIFDLMLVVSPLGRVLCSLSPQATQRQRKASGKTSAYLNRRGHFLALHPLHAHLPKSLSSVAVITCQSICLCQVTSSLGLCCISQL